MLKGKMTLTRVFRDYETPYDLGRSVYKYTDCGPWIAFVFASGIELHYENARNLTWRSMDDLKLVTIKVGSIVEGVDQCTDVIEVPVYPKRTLEKRFFAAVTAVNDEATEIWNQTHGCEDCGEENESGYISINPDCKTCGGEGVIL